MEYRLLIADDQHDLVAALRNQFFLRGYEVLSAEDGNTALQIVNHADLDLILLDIEMPGLSGLEVLKRAKERLPEAKVIVMTGHAEFENEARRLGCDLFLAKPFTFDQLEKSITSLLESKGFDEVRSYSIHGQMTRAPKGAPVADIVLVEPISMFAETIASFLNDASKSGGYYRIYTVDTKERAVVLQESLFIQIVLVDLRTTYNVEAMLEELLSGERPPVALIHYLQSSRPIRPEILEKGTHWNGNPLQENDLRQLANMLREIAQSHGLVKK